MAIAWVVFRENVDRRIFAGAIAILAGAVLFSWPSAAGPQLSWRSALIILACVSWGIDNNLTRKLSDADPLQIEMIKGLAAGTLNLALALAGGVAFPALTTLAAAAAVGFFGYGISLALFFGCGCRFIAPDGLASTRQRRCDESRQGGRSLRHIEAEGHAGTDLAPGVIIDARAAYREIDRDIILDLPDRADQARAGLELADIALVEEFTYRAHRPVVRALDNGVEENVSRT
jgi:hypothetical protein